MAGKRQHYVPQFLQRGFLHDPHEKAERTWLHRRRTQPRLVGIRDVGVSEYFYSKLRADGVATLDDLITSIEANHVAEVAALKCAPVGTQIDSGTAARLTTHLLLRTAHVRSAFAQGAIQILDKIASLLNDSDTARDLLEIDGQLGATTFQQALDGALRKLPLEKLSIPRPFAQRALVYFAREQFDALHGEFQSAITDTLKWVMGQIPGWIRDAHNSALEKSKGERWQEYLATLHWRTCAASEAVLPDCIVLAREAGQDFIPFLLSEKDCVELVILPLAHDRLLMGSRALDIEIAEQDLNAASAACSDDFFIARSPRDGEGLSELIGQRSSKAIETSVDHALSIHRPRHEVTADRSDSESDLSEMQTGTSFSFSLTCAGLADPGKVTQLGEIVSAVVQEMSRSMPLSSLDGITFAVDYATAVLELDRGDPALAVDRSHPRAYGEPVAKGVAVARDGQSKTHIVVDANIAHGLLSLNQDERAVAVHTLVTMLAGIAYTALHANRLTDALAAASDEVVRFLHQCVSTVPYSYFAARKSAFSDPTAGERYVGLVMDSLASARKTIEKARLQYRGDSDLDSLLKVAIPQISFVLGHAAEWLGHRDGLPDQEEFPGASLPDQLRVFELHNWLELFGRDLQAIYATDEQFMSTRIFALSRHAERLLWTVQICPWPTEDGSVYISVPMGEDASLLESGLVAAPP